MDLRLADLRFFLTNRESFLKSILDGYLKGDDRNRRAVEATVTASLTGRFTTTNLTRPRLSGFSGGFDTQYEETHLGDLDYNFPCLIEKTP